jgi:hypothetical protein
MGCVLPRGICRSEAETPELILRRGNPTKKDHLEKGGLSVEATMGRVPPRGICRSEAETPKLILRRGNP